MFGQEEEAAIGRQTEQQTGSREPDAGVARGRGRRARSGTGDNKVNEEKRSKQNTEKTETQRSKRSGKKREKQLRQRAEKRNEQIQIGNKSRQK